MIKSKNRHSRKILFLLVGLISCFVKAQQEAQYTQYMYITQVFNPAFAGNRGIMSLKALVRSQWVDVEKWIFSVIYLSSWHSILAFETLVTNCWEVHISSAVPIVFMIRSILSLTVASESRAILHS